MAKYYGVHLVVLLVAAAVSHVAAQDYDRESPCDESCHVYDGDLDCRRHPKCSYDEDRLRLSDRGIENLERGMFSHFQRLTDIDLRRNSIRSVPAGTFDGSRVEKIHLGSNKISTVARGVFSQLTNIGHVYLDSNEITEVEEGAFIGSAPSFKVITLHRNRLEKLTPRMFDGLSNANFVYLSGNRIENLTTGVFDGLSRLKYMELSHNRIKSMQRDTFDILEALQVLWLGHNQIVTLPSGVLDNLHNLQHLFLENNQIVTLPSGVFDKVPRLNVLHLHNNQIVALESGVFDNVYHLKTLNLNNNNIVTLQSGVFDKLLRLQYLYLSNNNIVTLQSGVFDNSEALYRLDLSNNNISTLPWGVFDQMQPKIPYGGQINLRGNYFTPGNGLCPAQPLVSGTYKTHTYVNIEPDLLIYLRSDECRLQAYPPCDAPGACVLRRARKGGFCKHHHNWAVHGLVTGETVSDGFQAYTVLIHKVLYTENQAILSKDMSNFTLTVHTIPVECHKCSLLTVSSQGTGVILAGEFSKYTPHVRMSPPVATGIHYARKFLRRVPAWIRKGNAQGDEAAAARKTAV